VDGSGAFIKREKSLSEWMKFDAPMAPPTDLPGAIEHWNASGRMELLEVTDKILTTFSPLLEVQGLTKLHVEGKKYKDYSPLCKLTELTHLDIHDLKKDIQWISGLQQVSVLHFTRSNRKSKKSKNSWFPLVHSDFGPNAPIIFKST
jgi:hypothetical protein